MPQQKHLNYHQQRDKYPAASQNSMTPICMQGAPSSTHSPTSYNLFLCHRGSYCRPEKLELHPNQSTEAAKKKDTGFVLEPALGERCGRHDTSTPHGWKGRGVKLGSALFIHVICISAVYVKTKE